MKTTKKLKALLVPAVLMLCMLAMTGCGTKTVKLNKYITVKEGEGYDTLGTVSYEFDKDAFLDDYEDKIKFTKEAEELSKLASLDGSSAADFLLGECIHHSIDKTSELSNGDIVTVAWDCEDEIAEKCFNVELDYSDIKYTVTKLKPVEKFNAFDYLEVSFSGISPGGKIELKSDYEHKEMQYIDFSADNKGGIKNGDKVTVTAKIKDTAGFIKKFGSVLSQYTKEFTCENLDSYVAEVGEISNEAMKKLQAKGEEEYRAYVQEQWNKPENLKSITYAGNYFLTHKTGVSKENNYLYIIYEVEALNVEPEEMVKFYYYAYFTDLYVTKDGTCEVNLDSCTLPEKPGWFNSGETFSVGGYRYLGYQSLENLFNYNIKSKMDRYEFTSSMKSDTDKNAEVKDKDKKNTD